jgi:putative transcriptional regulator
MLYLLINFCILNNIGQLLIANPSIIGDVSFNRSVILLVDKNTEGAIGFIVNKPMEYNLYDLIPDIDSNHTVYYGGPVEQDNLYFIHNVPELIVDSVPIANGLFWGGNFDKTKILLNEGKLSSNQIRFFLGYSGWDKQQLENEIINNSWNVINNEYKENILTVETESFWKNKMIAFGGEYSLYANAPENPNLN